MSSETNAQINDVSVHAPILFTDPYLNELSSNIRARPVAWEGYVRAGVIGEEDARLLKSVDKAGRPKRNSTVEKDLELYATTIATVLDKNTRPDIIQFTLVLTGDLISVPGFTSAFLALSSHNETYPYGPLLRLLGAQDANTRLLSSKTLAELLGSISDVPTSVTGRYIEFLIDLSKSSSDSNMHDIAIQSYDCILGSKEAQKQVWENKNKIIPQMIKHIQNHQGNIQIQYNTLLVFWRLSFERKPAQDLNSDFKLIPVLFELIRNAVKEKVIRVAVAIIANLIRIAPDENIHAVIFANGLDLFKSLSQRKWTDAELIEDVGTVVEVLDDTVKKLSTFDEYESELLSGKLTWSSPHTQDEFWRENGEKFKDHDWKLVKELAKIVSTSQSNEVLAVACNDIKRLVKQEPESIKIFTKTGTKRRIMQLMEHADPEVRYQALTATQAFIAKAFN